MMVVRTIEYINSVYSSSSQFAGRSANLAAAAAVPNMEWNGSIAAAASKYIHSSRYN